MSSPKVMAEASKSKLKMALLNGALAYKEMEMKRYLSPLQRSKIKNPFQIRDSQRLDRGQDCLQEGTSPLSLPLQYPSLSAP